MIQIPLSEANEQLRSLLLQAATDDIILTSDGIHVGALIGFANEDDWFDFGLERDPRFLNRIAIARAQAADGKTTRLDDSARRLARLIAFAMRHSPGLLRRHAAPEFRSMTPEFYLVLHDDDLSDELADAVFEAGFDDSSFTMRRNHAAIWVNDREGELTQIVREVLEQARNGGLCVAHVEMDSAAFV